jgi:peptidyl-prolyl cis-trans isomerase B (cyclophilin B)
VGTTTFTTPSIQIPGTRSIVIELKETDAPNTCANFEKYVNDGFYDGLIFHRVIDNFMVQSGGYYPGMEAKPATYPPISLEISPNLRHIDGAVSMARTNDPNSATSQFFICDSEQTFLDDQYAVFGQVISGMEYVREISAVSTQTIGGFENVPVNDVTIISASLSTSGGKTYVTLVVDY